MQLQNDERILIENPNVSRKGEAKRYGFKPNFVLLLHRHASVRHPNGRKLLGGVPGVAQQGAAVQLRRLLHVLHRLHAGVPRRLRNGIANSSCARKVLYWRPRFVHSVRMRLFKRVLACGMRIRRARFKGHALCSGGAVHRRQPDRDAFDAAKLFSYVRFLFAARGVHGMDAHLQRLSLRHHASSATTRAPQTVQAFLRGPVVFWCWPPLRKTWCSC